MDAALNSICRESGLPAPRQTPEDFIMSSKEYKSLDQKLQELIVDINSYSSNLPGNDLYDLGKKMRTSLKLASPSLRSFYQKQRRIDKIRCMIETSAYFEECKNYLSLSKKLRYGDADDLIEKVNEITDILHKGTYPGQTN